MLHGAGIFTNMCPKNDPNIGKYTIHGAYRFYKHGVFNENISKKTLCLMGTYGNKLENTGKNIYKSMLLDILRIFSKKLVHMFII